MESRPYIQPRHSQTHMRRIWTYFTLFMLLASLIPALANPVVAQSDAEQADEATTEQTAEQPPDVEQPPDEGQAPDVEQPPDG